VFTKIDTKALVLTMLFIRHLWWHFNDEHNALLQINGYSAKLSKMFIHILQSPDVDISTPNDMIIESLCKEIHKLLHLLRDE
jgi:hypothetical protein